MSKLEKQKEKARSLEAKDPRGAIEAWQEILKLQEEEGEANPDLAIFNRVGDLYLKIKDPGQAADYYDRAVDKYAELGFHNNAIAMCNKVLRNAPARQSTYLKLAKLYAAKGFMTEAQQNFVQYAERMQKAGKIEHAFAALKEFTDISPESERLREILSDHLKMYGANPRASSAKINVPTATRPDGEDITKSGKRKTSVEVPPLELEPDCETATTDASHDIDDRPLIEESREHSEFVQTEEDTSISLGGRKSGFINLGIDGIVNQADQSGSLVFSGVDETPA